ncbi:Uncharacterised protein [Mycobacteroides abscessus]|nr:Uncharacterised protein [Mycobacteroides abscessus]
MWNSFVVKVRSPDQPVAPARSKVSTPVADVSGWTVRSSPEPVDSFSAHFPLVSATRTLTRGVASRSTVTWRSTAP